jgi:hypothetical protein
MWYNSKVEYEMVKLFFKTICNICCCLKYFSQVYEKFYRCVIVLMFKIFDSIMKIRALFPSSVVIQGGFGDL